MKIVILTNHERDTLLITVRKALDELGVPDATWKRTMADTFECIKKKLS